MGNDLRERPKDTYSVIWNAVWNAAGLDDGECESIAQAVLTAVGDLVTRQEMEEAVAKAVAEEREAIATLLSEHRFDVEIWDMEKECCVKTANYLSKIVRARSSDEGEE